MTVSEAFQVRLSDDGLSLHVVDEMQLESEYPGVPPTEIIVTSPQEMAEALSENKMYPPLL